MLFSAAAALIFICDEMRIYLSHLRAQESASLGTLIRYSMCVDGRHEKHITGSEFRPESTEAHHGSQIGIVLALALARMLLVGIKNLPPSGEGTQQA